MKYISLLIVVLLALFSGACSRKPSAAESATQAAIQQKPQPLEVSTVAVIERSMPRSIDLVGTLMADEEATVSSEVAGTIEEMNVELGTMVQQGQVITRLNPREFDLRVQQAKAALEQTRARLGLRGDSDTINPEETTDVKQAKAALDDARLKFDRAKRLVANGDVSQQRFDEADVNLRSAEARYQAAVDSIHNQMALIQQRRSELALAAKSLNDSILRATISGSVARKLVSRGEYISARSPVVVLVKMSPLKLRADIPEPYAPDTRTGQEVILSIDAMPGRTFRGRVARISPSMDEKTRSLTIEALIDNKDGALKPGLFAHVKVVSQNNTPVLMIPSKALVTFAGINKAYAIEGDHAVERQLKLGARTGDLIEVVAGLKAGDQVALNNLDRLANGTLVSVKNRATPAE